MRWGERHWPGYTKPKHKPAPRREGGASGNCYCILLSGAGVVCSVCRAQIDKASDGPAGG